MAKLVLKVIKSKEFEANGEKNMHYTCAYKGRVFGVSTLRFDNKDITVKDNTLTLNVDVEVQKNTSTDPLTGQVRTFLDIVPKCELELAQF
jgi:hypothetical protein